MGVSFMKKKNLFLRILWKIIFFILMPLGKVKEWPAQILYLIAILLFISCLGMRNPKVQEREFLLFIGFTIAGFLVKRQLKKITK